MENIGDKFDSYPRYLDEYSFTDTLNMEELISRFDSWMDYVPESINLRLSWVKINGKH